MFNYDANDRLEGDQYDGDGNTISSAGIENQYDFENRLVRHGYMTMVYDGDGNRVAETVGGVTTNYLVDTENPTGYSQVVEELQGGAVVRSYSWGHWLLAQRQLLDDAWTTSFYGYDGHGSARYLTDSAGAVTDTYDYDAFGNLISSTGTTPNNYLFAGEQYDPALGLYYNRARYYEPTRGRFFGMDSFEGQPFDPRSLHKYVYVNDDPTNRMDPSGNETLGAAIEAAAITTVLANFSTTLLFGALTARSMSRNGPAPDGYIGSFRLLETASIDGYGGYAGGGFDAYYDRYSHQLYFAFAAEAGSSPLALFKNYRGPGFSLTGGLVWGAPQPSSLSGFGVAAVWPSRLFLTLAGVVKGTNEAFATMARLAYLTKNTKFTDSAFLLGVSSSGATAFEWGPRSNFFGWGVTLSGEYIPARDLLGRGSALLDNIINRLESVLTPELSDDQVIRSVEELNP